MVRAVPQYCGEGTRFDSGIIHNPLAIEEMFFDILH